MAIPRSPADWSAIVPNETDRELAGEWRQAPLGIATGDELAAASRLHEQERCVAALAAWFGTQGGFSDDDGPTDMDLSQAHRILGCEPESGEKGVG